MDRKKRLFRIGERTMRNYIARYSQLYLRENGKYKLFAKGDLEYQDEIGFLVDGEPVEHGDGIRVGNARGELGALRVVDFGE